MDEHTTLRAPAATALIQIVEALARFDKSASMAEISSATGLNKNMISRILSVLADAGWITFQKESGTYSLSLQLFKLGSTALGKKTLMRCAVPYLKVLNDQTGECVQMAVLDEGKAVYIAQLESQKDAGIRARIGAGYPLDTTAPGKVLKAFVIQDEGMEEIRKRGYAVDNEEYGRGVVCLAAPVFDYTGQAIASIGIASLTVNQSLEELVVRCLGDLLEQVEKLSRELGYRQEGKDL